MWVDVHNHIGAGGFGTDPCIIMIIMMANLLVHGSRDDEKLLKNSRSGPL